MKWIASIAMVFLILTGVAHAAPGPDVVFSKYSSQLHLASYDEKTYTHTFRGRLRLEGMLYLRFGMAAPDRASGDLIFTRFVPDKEYLTLLPAVVSGSYPSPVRYVDIKAPQDQIVSLFGGREEYERISHGNSYEVSRRAEVVLKSYSALVECDSRVYFGEAISIVSPREPQVATRDHAPSGC